jgi:ABC-type sugar transport system ATPase subunit
LLSLSARILVLRGGRVVATLDRAGATEESVLRAMAGMATL